MELTTTHNTTESISCNSCLNQVDQNDTFCTACGYPLKGSEDEQKNFMMMKSTKEIYLHEENIKIKRASYALYYIAGATMIWGLVAYGTSKDIETKNSILIVNTILALIYASLGLWSKKKPLTAIISGFSLYVLVFILNAITDPLSIFGGIVFKIFIVVYFVRGIKSAIEADKLKKELNIE
ncbi:hypothetical protein ACPPVU_14165 [Mucilaginibacter sp. McL0603]|uniref:hypothetical protein n=1 Tax=Mucilaginibacter sp. McL0603 TaxID=3415670 RepID=UPI003CEEF6DB